MTSKILIPLALVAALGACNKEDQTIVGGPADPQADLVANAQNVVLPPAILASKSYRCKDNSVVYIDWLDNGGARVKSEKTEIGTEIAAGSTELTGDSKAASISYKGQSCKG